MQSFSYNSKKGECSRKAEGTNEDEKPLKKARYVWEVKGKYHLKETYKNNNNREEPAVFEESMNNEPATTTECNNNDTTNQCCIDAILAKTQAILDTNSNSDDEDENLDHNVADIPVTLVSGQTHEEFYLSRWQARQIARGFVDNTINSVLESCVNPPPFFDATDLVENCENDGQVEDEGIWMAIQSHGLRNGGAANPPLEEDVGSSVSYVREESAVLDNYQNELIIKEKMTSNESMVCDEPIPDEENLEMQDPIDFLNAAVSVAIQKKGLSYGY